MTENALLLKLCCYKVNKVDKDSKTDLRASRTGKRLSRAVSLGSLNQDLMGIALSGQNISWQIYRFEKSVEIMIIILLEHNMSTSPRPGGRGDTAQVETEDQNYVSPG